MDSRYLLPALLLGVAAALPAPATGASWRERIEAVRVESASWTPGDTLTFAVALARAFDHPSLLAAAARLEAADAAAGQASARPNPTLSAEAENVGGSYSGFDNAELSLLLTQEFELGGRRGARVAAARQASNAAAFEARNDTLELYLETRRRYADTVHAEEQHRIALRTSGVVAELVAAAETRVAAGAAPVSDRALASAALARARLEISRADGARRRARLALAALWGATGIAEPVSLTMGIPPSAAAANLDLPGADEGPALARVRLAAGALRAEHDVEKSLHVPPLSASVGVRRVEVDDAGTFLVGLSMPLPLWDRRRDAARAADARVRAAELAASRLRAEVSSEAAIRLETLDLLLVQLEQVDREVIPELQSAAEGLRTAYQLGSVSYPDLLEVQRALVAVQQEQNDTRRAIAAEIIAIEALTGMTIEEMSHE